MYNVAVNVPDAVLYDTHMDEQQVSMFAKRSVAVVYYTMMGVSLGYCAQIAEMTEEDFAKYLGERRVSLFHFDGEQEFADELSNV